MIRSMTGFGRSTEVLGGKEITVEIRSVNSRYLDCSVKISRSVGYLEERIKPFLQNKGISRGKVDVWISVETVGSGGTRIGLDEDYLRDYLSALYRLRDEFGLRDDISVMSVARRPELFVSIKPEQDVEKDWAELSPVLERAVDAFLAAREQEGERLCADIRGKINSIRKTVDEIETLSEGGPERYRERLAERIREALADNRVTPDESRILTECAIFADKVAIDEELVRLRSHFEAFEGILASDEAIGRRLDFLMQEINREINTTGSKCNDAEIARRVVDVKCELEKIREQIQNLE